MPLHPIPKPRGLGREALVGLRAVPWAALQMAYHHREHPNLCYDVEASLRELGHDGAAAMHALYSNVCHQGTTYEATAYAVPFLAAFAAGEIDPLLRLQVTQLIADIALSSSFATEDGCYSGAYGEGVDELIRGAIVGCATWFADIQGYEASLAVLFDAIHALASEPSRERFETLHALYAALEARILDERDRPVPAATPVETVRYRHSKLGDAVLVRKQENGLLLRFDDGKERVVQERFLTRIG